MPPAPWCRLCWNKVMIMVVRKKGQRGYNPADRCQCGGRWIVPKRNGAFRIGGSKSRTGRDPIRANWPTIKRHVPWRGWGSRPYTPTDRLREFAICPACGERNLAAEQRRARKSAPPGTKRWWGIEIEPEPEPAPEPPKRNRDFSEDAEKRKAKARRHKARQARR